MNLCLFAYLAYFCVSLGLVVFELRLISFRFFIVVGVLECFCA